MTERDPPSRSTGQSSGFAVDPVALAGQHPADAADTLQALPPDQAAEVLAAMPAEAAAETLGAMPAKDAERYVTDMSPPVAASAIGRMAPDDAVDLLGEISEAHRTQILAELPAEERAQLEELLTYRPDTAGGIMSPEVTALGQELTVAEAIAALRRIADQAEQMYYAYVVDESRRLVGVLSLRDLILAPQAKRLGDIMLRDVVTVPATMDREDVSALLSKYGYLALPVVSAANRLLGIVTVDDVVGVIQQEATEDMHRMVGAGPDERINSAVTFVLRRRVPWLVVNLGTAFLASFVVGTFEQTLKALTGLAVLLPIVAGQAGNTGLQSMAVMIRGIATGEAQGLRLWRILVRQISIGIGAGLLIGATCALGCLVWRRDVGLAVIIGIAMVVCMILATVSGALIPWLMKRLGFDPAQSASIVLTTVTDVAGFGIFLALGTLLVTGRP